MLGKGLAKAISDDDIARFADSIGAHPADVEAISKVESGGFGWFADGRIKILFEKHIFWKYLDAKQKEEALNQAVGRPKFIPPSMGGYKDQANPAIRYRILEKAIAINRDAAFNAISIGRYQIMGFNHTACGFSSAEMMFKAFCDSEEAQLRAFGRFLRSKNLIQAIRDRDFAKIEQGYNGGGLKGAYARKMKAESDKLHAGKWKNYVPMSQRNLDGM